MGIVFASGNPDKLRELKALLSSENVIGIRELFPDWKIEETGLTLEENALLKARAALECTGKTAIADDTGLFVWALGDAPGLYTARYAGEGCSYLDNTKKLINALKCEREHSRKAFFKTVIALVTPSGDEKLFTGVVEGKITEAHSGVDGFGYDPVFFSSELNKTFAECTFSEKNSVSHRARAMRKLNSYLSEQANRWV